MDNAARVPEEHFFTTHDGFQLFYRFWPALETNEQEDPGAVLLFHRGHEHGGRMAHLVDELALPEQAFFAWDCPWSWAITGRQRRQPLLRYQCPRHSDLCGTHRAQTWFQPRAAVCGGPKCRCRAGQHLVHDYAPSIRALVLASPAFSVKLYVPLAIPGLKLLRSLKGNFFVNSYVKAKLLTHDPCQTIQL